MASQPEAAQLPSAVANKSDATNSERPPVVNVPTPTLAEDKRRRTAPQAPSPPSVDVWCRILIGKIFEGNLQGLNRVSTLISHLEPTRGTTEARAYLGNLAISHRSFWPLMPLVRFRLCQKCQNFRYLLFCIPKIEFLFNLAEKICIFTFSPFQFCYSMSRF
jgi:hypothetical protein